MGIVYPLEPASLQWLVVGYTRRSRVPSVYAFAVGEFVLRHQVVLGHDRVVMEMPLQAMQHSKDDFVVHSEDILDTVLASCCLQRFEGLEAVVQRLRYVELIVETSEES